MEFSQVINLRYSSRKFDTSPMENDKLQKIVETARPALPQGADT